MKSFFTLLSLLVLSVQLLSTTVQSTILSQLSVCPVYRTHDHIGYQARITLSDGNPLTNGPHVFVFTLHDHETTSSPVWSETRTETTIDGLLSVRLGETNPITLDDLGFSGQDTARVLYLDISVDSETISPRTKLVSSPFANVAARMLGDVETGPGNLLIRDPITNDSAISLSMNDSNGARELRIIDQSTGGERAVVIIGALTTLGGNLNTSSTGSGGEKTEVTMAALTTLGGKLSTSSTGASGKDGVLIEVGPPGPVPASSKLFVGGLSFQDRGASIFSDVDSSRLDIIHDLGGSGIGGRIGVGATSSNGNIIVSNIGISGDETFVESVVAELQGIVVLCNTDGVDSTKVNQFVTPDSSGISLRMNKADLTNGIAMSTSQTREHILLSRQVGLPNYNQSMELDVDSLGTVFSHSSTDAFGDFVVHTTSTRNNKFESVASKVTSTGPTNLRADPSFVALDSSKVVSLMDDIMVLSAIYVNDDSAATTEATSNKRKQSLYFPESFHSAIDLLVDGTASMIILKKVNPASGLPDSNIVMDNDGNLTMSGSLNVAGANGMQVESTSLTVPRISTSQRNALVPINGMIVYNTTTSQFNFYENNAWVTK